MSHPIEKWTIPTKILYGAKDIFQSITSMRNFAERFGANITVSENSEHPFMAPEDFHIVDKWLMDNI